MNANLYIKFEGPAGCGKSRVQQMVEGMLLAEGFTITKKTLENPTMLEVKVPVRENPAQTKLPIA